MDQLRRRFRIVCPECGGENVSADAAARWDFGRQKWVVDNIFDKGHSCDDCGEEIDFVLEEVPENPEGG